MFTIVAIIFSLFTITLSSYTCNYQKILGMTIHGANMPTLGNAASGATGADCADQCCQMPDCYAMCTTNCRETNGDCKRGLAYNLQSPDDLYSIRKGVSWWYNWGHMPNPNVTNETISLNSEFVPMIWGGLFNVTQLIIEIPRDAKYILGFNEPNFISEANLSPASAAALWPKIQQVALARNLKIVGPAVNYCGPSSACHTTDPYVYLDQFFAACTNCIVDYLAVHWYACFGPALTQYLAGFRKYGRLIWVTEFSCANPPASIDDQNTYMQQALEALDNDPFVFRYAWFSGRTTNVANANLFGDASGTITVLGNTYTSQNVNGSCDGKPFPLPPGLGTYSSAGRRVEIWIMWGVFMVFFIQVLVQ